MTKEVAYLLRRVRKYAKRAGCTESVASLRIFNDGKRVKQLKEGSKMWPDTITESLKRIDELEAKLAA